MASTELTALAFTLALVCTLSACSSDPAEPQPTPVVSESQTATQAPTDLSFGDAKTVTWKPTNSLSDELSIRIDAVREGRISDFKGLVADGITGDNQPYYVDVVIANKGDAEVGGLDVPLYLMDSNATLSPPSKFANPFGPCRSGPLAASFGAGAKAQMCLVFFASPGAKFDSVTFRPTSDAAAVMWSGDVAVPAQKPTKKQRPRPKDHRR